MPDGKSDACTPQLHQAGREGLCLDQAERQLGEPGNPAIRSGAMRATMSGALAAALGFTRAELAH